MLVRYEQEKIIESGEFLSQQQKKGRNWGGGGPRGGEGGGNGTRNTEKATTAGGGGRRGQTKKTQKITTPASPRGERTTVMCFRDRQPSRAYDKADSRAGRLRGIAAVASCFRNPQRHSHLLSSCLNQKLTARATEKQIQQKSKIQPNQQLHLAYTLTHNPGAIYDKRGMIYFHYST